jgi:hypothetical protein
LNLSDPLKAQVQQRQALKHYHAKQGIKEKEKRKRGKARKI